MESHKEKTPAKYGKIIFLHKNQKCPRFDRLNPEIVRELFSSRSSFHYLKEVALACLEETVNEQLDMLTLKDKCDYPNMEKLSNNIFAWSSKEYLKRRAQKNCVWVDLIRTHKQEDCLERFKLHTDLKEIKSFLKLIFQSLQKFPDNYNLEQLVCQPLREAERNLDILEKLCDKNEELKEIIKGQKDHINARLYTKRNTKEQRLLWRIEESIIRAQTSNPIQMRFESNWYKIQTEQAQLKSDLMETNAQKGIDELKFKIHSEEISGHIIRDTYYAIIEQYKHDIEELQNHFNVQLEEIDNKMNYTRSEISKMVEQQKLLRKEIEKFHEEIKQSFEEDESKLEKHERKNRKRTQQRTRKGKYKLK